MFSLQKFFYSLEIDLGHKLKDELQFETKTESQKEKCSSIFLRKLECFRISRLEMVKIVFYEELFPRPRIIEKSFSSPSFDILEESFRWIGIQRKLSNI